MQNSHIATIRSFNRFYTNVLGLLDHHILESDYSLTEIRVLHEISKSNHCTANMLVNLLDIDRSYMSRIIKHLEKASLIKRVQSSTDSRAYQIVLSKAGRELIESLNQKSDQQIEKLYENISQDELEKILDAMYLIKERISDNLYTVKIRNYEPDDIEYMIERHQSVYPREYGLSDDFVKDVERVINDFASQIDTERECVLIAEEGTKRLGSIAIVNVDEDTAQLRFFLLEPEARGKGTGKKLVKAALDFCKTSGYKQVYLETISRLKTARHLYKSFGFEITSSHEYPVWGEGVVEERWDKKL